MDCRTSLTRTVLVLLYLLFPCGGKQK